MTNISHIKWPAVASSLLVLPFMILEWVNRGAFNESYPIPLFAIMWLLPLAFILILAPIIRDFRAKKRLAENPLSILLKGVILIFIAWLWMGILLDQMPCFLGIPNCD